MAITSAVGFPSKGIDFTQVTDTSADFAAVANSTYFYNLADKIVRYKDATGTVLEVFSTSGGNGLQGVHSVMPLASGDATTFTVTSPNWSGTNFTNSRLVLVPYIPAQTINSDALQYFVNINVAGSLCRLLIYSDLNGNPDTKLYESSDIDCSTTGLKTVLNSFTFNAGTRYWIAFHGGSIASGTINVTGAGMMPIKSSSSSTPQTFTFYYVSVALDSAPTTITSKILTGGNVPYVGIRIA
jgi:hypothetical protein